MDKAESLRYYRKTKEFKAQYDYNYLLHNCSRYIEEGFEEDAHWLRDNYELDSDIDIIDLLKKTVVFYSDSEKYYERAVPLNFKYSPNIREALRTVDDKDLVLHLFENEDHNWMALFQETYNHITRKGRFFLDENELKETVLNYLRFLENNREAIVKTGFANTKFNENEWFDFFFTNTLPVKLPVNIYGGRINYQHFYDVENELAEKDEHGDIVYHHRWISGDVFDWWRRYEYTVIKPVVDGKAFFRDSTGLFDLVNEEPLCSYDEASYIQSLTDKDVECAESLRESVFEWKLDILNTLLEFLYEGQKRETFYYECLRKLSDKMSSEEIECLYGLDKKYDERNVGEYLAYFQRTYFAQPHIEDFFVKILERAYIESEYSNRYYTWNLSGGMEALFGLIGFFQKELLIGTCTQARKEFKEIFPQIDSVNSYYRAIEIAGKEQVEGVLINFLNRMGEEQNYWEYYKRKEKSLIEKDFTQKVTLSMQLKGKYIQTFYPVLESIAGTIEHEINEYGNIQSVFGKSGGKQISPEKAFKEYLFRKAGEGFELSFNGRPSFFLKETVGLNYIYILLTNMNKPLSIQDIISFNNGGSEKGQNIDTYEDSVEKVTGNTNKAYSSDDMKLVVKKLKELSEEYREANDRGNYDKAEELRYQIEKLQEYIRKSQNQKNDPELERMRTKVKNAINHAIQKIKTYDSELAQHFEEKISTGYTCIYTLSPADKIEWKFK